MLVIKKFTVGVVPLVQMFRVASLSGAIADEIVAGLKDQPIRNPEFFTEVAAASTAHVQLRSKERGNFLLISPANIVFTQERFKSSVNIDKSLEEFAQLWNIIDEILEVQEIRRIGMVAEHRISDIEEPSKRLISALTKYPQSEYSAKFYCSFEKRIPLARPATQLNVKVDEFTNVIHQFYDSELDLDTPEERAFNVNLDVQRYYSDQLGDGVTQEVKSFQREFESQWREFQTQIKLLGLIE